MIRTLTRWVGLVALVATLLLAGGHVLYYLYYWEWVRAQIAALLFLAAAVVAATRIVLDRIAKAEQRVAARLEALERTLAAGVPEPSRGGPRAPRPEPAASAAPAGPAGPTESGGPAEPAAGPDFPWLAPELSPRPAVASVVLLVPAALLEPVTEARPAVFIPILLGAGLAVSVLAGLVERLAAAVQRARRRGATRRLAVAFSAAVLVAALGTGAIWHWVHYRPAPFAAGVTELTVQVSTHSWPRPPEQTVEVIGRYCARNAISGVTVRDVHRAGSDVAVLVVSPVLDEQGRRRYVGCLEDAHLERHRLSVLDTGAARGGEEP